MAKPGVSKGALKLPGEQLRVVVVVSHVYDEHLLQLGILKPVALPAVNHQSRYLGREHLEINIHQSQNLQVLTLLAV